MKNYEKTEIKLQNVYDALNGFKMLQAIREGLIMIFPIIMIGAFALVLRSFPVDGYLSFIQNFAGGCIDRFLKFIFQGTFGMLSLYMVVSLSISCVSKYENGRESSYGAIFSSLLFFGFMSGMLNEDSNISSCVGVTAIFTAIMSALVATRLYLYFQRKLWIKVRFYALGTGETYHNMLKFFVPITLIALLATVLNYVIRVFFGAGSFQEIYTMALRSLFAITGRNFLSGLLYVLIVHILWFFGIHGGNVMEAVHKTCLEPALDINIQLVAQGSAPTEIYSKTFFDVFVLMGGCGSTLCLLLTIFLFERKKNLRKLAKFSVVPSIFNINELLVFGVPIVFNPIMLIPFLLTPVANLIISTLAMKTGLVPIVASGVEWTTPIFLGGYFATGSIAGAILQAVNLFVGVMIYRPFVRVMSRADERNSMEKMKKLVNHLCESEKSGKPVNLLTLPGDRGVTAKLIVDELENFFLKEKPTMYYQPQYNSEGRCIGAEALLRWKHPVYGMVYPPLVMKLLDEIGKLTVAEKNILKSVLSDMDDIKEKWGPDVKISVNVTGGTIQLKEYQDYLIQVHKVYPQHIPNIMLEITEQASLQIDDALSERLLQIKELGYRFAIDDFSMGSTSVKYLKSSVFDLIKLDGSLTKDILTDKRSRGIVKTLVQMADEFNLQILAEYVETKEQKNLLEHMGCYLYQGYLYSPAIPKEKYCSE